jgi:exodeoxyribonuclease VII small subunit
MTGPTDAPTVRPGPADALAAPSAPSAPERSTTEADTLTFDAALAELERTVATLESGGGQLEETIALYERAVALERRCSGLLAEARLRMEQLVERAGGGLDATTIRTEDTAADA